MSQHIGKKTVFSSQEATELIFMDTESEGEDIDLGEDFLGKCNIDSDSDIKQDEEESSEDEEITFTRKKKGIIFFLHKVLGFGLLSVSLLECMIVTVCSK